MAASRILAGAGVGDVVVSKVSKLSAKFGCCRSYGFCGPDTYSGE